MRRRLIYELVQWKNMEKDRMPLVLYGARQVGKTYLLQNFAEEYYKNSIYVNFERMPIVAEMFSGDLSPERIITYLERFFGVEVIPGDTLIIFDEIQMCERALTSLKYFSEEAPEYHVMAAGSLLGVAVNREKYSFPVGKVIMKTLYPLGFDEFLEAIGKEHYVMLINEHGKTFAPIPEETHKELLEWYRLYLYIGGMPASVREYTNQGTLNNIPEIQNMILNSYLADMSKYADNNESAKIRGAFQSLPVQLSKENKKFQYKLIRRGATANLFGESIDWLLMAGIVWKCNKVERGEIPLAMFQDLSAFKLYVSDTGLLTAMMSLMPQNILNGEMSDTLKGALTENYVAQVLGTRNYPLYYWEADGRSEVDFVIQRDGKVIPVEVKYHVNTKAKSLGVFMKRYDCEYAIRISGRNFGLENQIKSIPLYAAFLI